MRFVRSSSNQFFIHVLHAPALDQDQYALGFLDIEQVCNSVCWDYVWQVLDKIGLCQNYLKWIKLLYQKAVARVQTGRYVSTEILLQRGTRPGCPLPPLIFALAMEPLTCHLRQTLRRWGIQVGHTVHLVSLYTDDAMIHLRQPDISGSILLNVMREF